MQSKNAVVVAILSEVPPEALELLARAESSAHGVELALLELLELQGVPPALASRVTELVREFRTGVLAVRSVRKATGVSL